MAVGLFQCSTLLALKGVLLQALAVLLVLHVARVVSAARAKRRDVVDDIPLAALLWRVDLVVLRAHMGAHEFSPSRSAALRFAGFCRRKKSAYEKRSNDEFGLHG